MKKLLDDPSVRSWRAIMTAFQGVFSTLEKGLMSEGFHVSRFQIFFYLYFQGAMSAAELARHLLVTRGNISMFLRRLEKDGQIMMCPTSPSMQRPLYRLTPRAEKTFEAVFPRHIERVRKLVPKMPAAVLKSLLHLADGHPLNKL